MSDPITPPPAPTPEPPKAPEAPPAGDPQTPPATPKPDDAPLGEPGKKALEQERTARAEAERLLRETQTRLQEFTDRDKTEAEKAAERLAAAEAKAAEEATKSSTATAELTRYQVAVEKQVPPHLVEFVTGGTREEVEASVQKVLAAFGAKPTGPIPDPGQGVGGGPVGLQEQIAAAEAAGDIKKALRLKAAGAVTTN